MWCSALRAGAGLAFLGLRFLGLKESPKELQAADRLKVLLHVFTVATGKRGELAHVFTSSHRCTCGDFGWREERSRCNFCSCAGFRFIPPRSQDNLYFYPSCNSLTSATWRKTHRIGGPTRAAEGELRLLFLTISRDYFILSAAWRNANFLQHQNEGVKETWESSLC